MEDGIFPKFSLYNYAICTITSLVFVFGQKTREKSKQGLLFVLGKTHREGYSLLLNVDRQDLHPDDVSHREDLGGMLYVFVAYP